jgi:hypothetical protein
MSVTVTSPPSADTAATVRQLALVDAKRFARHPLFIIGSIATFGFIPWAATYRSPSPLVGLTLLQAFFLGIFGLIIAHRLTTSLRRSHELVDSLPSSEQQRTMALCLACGVPFIAGIASTVVILVSLVVFPPDAPAPDRTMTWFGYYPWLDVVAALLGMGTIAALGGPLLGVLIAKWAPFRGSALIAVVGIFFVCEASTHWPVPWAVVLPWSALADDHVKNGVMTGSSFVPGVSEVWFCVYALLMCGLAVVAAMLRDPGNRRRLLWTGAALAVAAAGALTLTVT